MARGKRQNKRGKQKFKPNSKKHSKQKTKETWRDIKHSEQIRQFRKNLQNNTKEEKRESSDDEIQSDSEVQIDPIAQLLSTFQQAPIKTGEAVDSDEDSSEEEVEDVKNDKEEREENKESEHEDVSEEEDEIFGENPETNTSTDTNKFDPFQRHFNFDLHDTHLDVLMTQPVRKDVKSIYWDNLHNINIEIPVSPHEEVKESETKIQKLTILEDKEFAKKGTIPEYHKSLDWNKLGVKQQLAKNICAANAKQINLSVDGKTEQLTPLQKDLFFVINNYQDMLYCERTFNNEDQVRFVYCLHMLNHMLKTRHKIVSDNEKLTKKLFTDLTDDFQDQGLVRPKVLVLVPFRDSCLRIVNQLISLLFAEEKNNVINKTRFLEEFSGSELHLPKKNPKPEDYESLFKGNIDDTFKIGLSITKKSIKLYTDFYASDIIIASPLGLRLIIGAEGEKERDYDFLASIELLILDQAEVFFMQNWEHLLHIFDHLHLQPKDSHGTDISRIRSWTLNGWSKYYRQTLMLSSVMFPDLVGLFNRRCLNYAGRITVNNPIDSGTISQVFVQLPQVFNKFKASSVVESIDERFDMFVTKILPQFKDSVMSGVLIYIPSYFDYVRLRNYLKIEELNFVQVCEYSKDSKVARARDMFYHDQVHFMLYSERFHFFRRVRLKGIRHVIFYQPPTIPHFYSEICNLMQENNQNQFLNKALNLTVTVLYCKYDVYQLNSIVSSARATRMVSSDKDVHMFTTK